MKKTIVLFLFLSLFFGCQSNGVEKPENLIDEDQMVNIYYDLQIFQAIQNSMPDKLTNTEILLPGTVLKKYKVTEKQFQESDFYYAQNIKKYKEIYEKVNERLKAEKDTLMKLPKKSLQVK